jgi:hypothetical protein
MHFDNARPQMVRGINVSFPENGMTKASDPMSSQDLAPSDCCLFGKLKKIMKRCAFGNENE